MECPQRFTHRLLPTTTTVAQNCFKNTSQFRNYPLIPLSNQTAGKPIFSLELITTRRYRSPSSSSVARASWLLGLGVKKKKQNLPDIVKAGDPVLHEPARDVSPEEIGSERIQKMVDDMVKVMRTVPGVGLAAPQIGIPLKVS